MDPTHFAASIGLAVPAERTRRALCPRCQRPLSVCYCAALVELRTRTRVVILQHPREKGMPIGTARMAHLCLPRSQLHVGIDWDGSDVLRAACADPERPPVLLYPGPDARDILQAPPATPVTLIVLDGTWSQARALVRQNPGLARLPRYAFQPPEPSNYRIRKEPRLDYVSTLEALMHVLGVLEGDVERFRTLMGPMNTMVDAQLAAQARDSRPRFPLRRQRLTPTQRMPGQIFERYTDIVLVFGDSNAWPHDTPEHRLGDELVHWVACRPSTGETFGFVLAPRHPLSPGAPRHTELAREDLLGGGSLENFRGAFTAFTRPTDVFCSWGHHGLRLFLECGGVPFDEFLDLRQAARELTHRKNGTLEEYAASTVARPVTTSLPGRAGRRLGMLMGILESWRGLGCREEDPARG